MVTREIAYEVGTEAVLAGKLTLWVIEPLLHATVMGRPGIGGFADRVHDVAFVVEADTATDPPLDGTVGGFTEMEPIIGGGVASTFTVTSEAVAPPGPVAVTVTTYDSIAAVVLAGSTSAWEKVPPVQSAAAGSPTTVGVIESAQVVALPVIATIVVLPPEGDSDVGLAPIVPMVGADWLDAASTETT